MTATPFLPMGHERFVSLATFRRSGDRVATPVWIAREGDELLVTTPAGSGKVKRLRNDSRVELRPCSRSGKVDDGAPTASGTAHIVDDPDEVERIGDVFLQKYGLEYRTFMLIERMARKGSGNAERAILRIRES